MEDINVIQLLDKISKNLQRGAIPIALNDINGTIIILERKMNLSKGERIIPLIIPQDETPTEIQLKLNEVCRFINNRFPL